MIALLAPLLVQAVAPAFAPQLDEPVAFSTSEVRQDGARTQRFAIDRQVIFRRADDGYVAEVETLRVTGDATGAGPMFEAMARSTLGQHIRIRLDRNGIVKDIDGLDAVWNAQLAAMTGVMTSKEPARAVLVESLLAPLRSLPRSAKVKRIGEMIAPLIVDRAYAPTASRAITVSARGPNGAPTLLAGTETITAQPNRRLLLERVASGIVGASTRSMSLRRWIDVSMGIVLETKNIETIATADARLIITRTTEIKPPVF